MGQRQASETTSGAEVPLAALESTELEHIYYHPPFSERPSPSSMRVTPSRRASADSLRTPDAFLGI